MAIIPEDRNAKQLYAKPHYGICYYAKRDSPIEITLIQRFKYNVFESFEQKAIQHVNFI